MMLGTRYFTMLLLYIRESSGTASASYKEGSLQLTNLLEKMIDTPCVRHE